MTTLDQILNALKESGCFVGDIYDAIDEVKAKDERIKELEEAMKPKSCDDCMFDYCGCSVQDSIFRADNTATFETFCCNSFKKKDNA